MKIIKLKDDYYVVVDDSEIKKGDFVYDTITNTIWTWEKYTEDEIDSKYSGKVFKITHSTQPLESIVTENSFKSYEFIPLQEVKELIGEVNVEIKTREEVERYMISTSSIDLKAKIQRFQGYMKGYNQALEDNKEKKYTEEDMRKAYMVGKHGGVTQTYYEFDEYIQQLQPKTEWEVEIVDGKLKLK